MTHKSSPDFPTFFGVPGISIAQQFNFAEHGFNLMNLSINERTSTHIDAPLHFSADGVEHFPGFHVEATQMLLEETTAIDTLSLDRGPSPDFATQYAWQPAARYDTEFKKD